jgi:hypothetical protein
MEYLLYIIIGLYVWEVFFRKWCFKKVKLIKDSYKNKNLNWYKNTVIEWVKSRF